MTRLRIDQPEAVMGELALLPLRRHRQLADAALAGTLNAIAQFGGGVVESHPEDTVGRKVSGSFLYNPTVAMFERFGFERRWPIGKHDWVVSRRI